MAERRGWAIANTKIVPATFEASTLSSSSQTSARLAIMTISVPIFYNKSVSTRINRLVDKVNILCSRAHHSLSITATITSSVNRTARFGCVLTFPKEPAITKNSHLAKTEFINRRLSAETFSNMDTVSFKILVDSNILPKNQVDKSNLMRNFNIINLFDSPRSGKPMKINVPRETFRKIDKPRSEIPTPADRTTTKQLNTATVKMRRISASITATKSATI